MNKLISIILKFLGLENLRNLRKTQKPPTQKPPTQEPPTQKPPTQEPPTQKPPTQKPPTQKPPTQKPPTQKPPTQKPPTQKPPTQEPPTQKPPTQKPPTQKPPTQESPTQEPSPPRRPLNNKKEKGDKIPTPPPPPKYRPDLICGEESGRWRIYIEDNSEIESIRQEDELESNDDVYAIPKIEDIEVTLRNGECETIHLEKDKPLIFRIGKNWEGRGRRAKCISPNYHYVVFTPKCCGGRIGKGPVENEETFYDDYRAHFFPSNESSKEDGFENCAENIFSDPKYSLTGKIIRDNGRDNIYSSLPNLETKDEPEKATEIHIGYEGTSGWRKSYDMNNFFQLPDKLEGRGGWFFVRVYEGKPPLVFSDSFRFLPGLKDIKINDKFDWKDQFIHPDSNEHYPTLIEFITSDDIFICPEEKVAHLLNQEKSSNIFHIPCREDLDKTKWTLENEKGHKINVDIHLNRIWWRYYAPNREDEWRATPIEIKREEIRNASSETETGIEILINYSSPLRSIRLGFKEEDALRFRISSQRATNYQYTGKFSLWDIKHNQNIKEPISENLFLRMWITDHEHFSVPIISVPADAPPPPPRPDTSSDIPEPQCPSGRKRGIRPAKGHSKRYSKRELKEAGVCYTVGMEIRIDKRRKTCHEFNVQTLTEQMEKYNATKR